MIPEDIKAQIKPGVRVKIHDSVGFFEGLVIARKHGSEEGATFTVRSILGGVGVEKIYPFASPSIDKIEVTQKPKRVRRSKLYWLRNVPGKKIRKRIGLSV